MRTVVCRNAIGAAVLMFATGSAVAEDSGVLAVYTYPIEAVQRAAADALTDIGCEIEKNQGGYIEGVRRHKFGAFAGSGGERVSVNLTSASEGITSVDIRTKRTFVGYVQQRNWDETVRDGIRQHMVAPAARKDEPQARASPPPPAAERKKEAAPQSSFVFAQSQSSAPNATSADGAAIARGLAVIAVVAADVFVASKGYTPAPVVLAAPSPAPASSQSAIMCPDGSYVSRPPCTLCPNGHYVGGSSTCSATQLAPDGTIHPSSGLSKLCPDGTYVTGTACVLTPNGRYVGR